MTQNTFDNPVFTGFNNFHVKQIMWLNQIFIFVTIQCCWKSQRLDTLFRQNLKIIVNGNSDQIKAKQTLQKILTTRFDWVKDRKRQYLDQDVDIAEFAPKISMSLEDRGVAYTLHFPCHFQKYNEIYDQLLTEVLTEFKKEDIKIGFIV